MTSSLLRQCLTMVAPHRGCPFVCVLALLVLHVPDLSAQVMRPRGEIGPTGALQGEIWLGGDITARRVEDALVVVANDALDHVYAATQTDDVGGYVLTQLPRNVPLRIVAFYSGPVFTGSTERRVRIASTGISQRANLLFQFQAPRQGYSDPSSDYGHSPLGLVEYALHILNVIMEGQVEDTPVAPRYRTILEQVAQMEQTLTPDRRPDSVQLFRVTSRPMSNGSANDEMCRSLFGRQYQMADWTDVARALRQGLSPDRILPDGHAWVTRSGERRRSRARPYFMSRTPVHAGYLVHDRLGSSFVLGSWDGSYPLLCYAGG